MGPDIAWADVSCHWELIEGVFEICPNFSAGAFCAAERHIIGFPQIWSAKSTEKHPLATRSASESILVQNQASYEVYFQNWDKSGGIGLEIF